MQILAFLTRNQCRVPDTLVTVKARGSLVQVDMTLPRRSVSSKNDTLLKTTLKNTKKTTLKNTNKLFFYILIFYAYAL